MKIALIEMMSHEGPETPEKAHTAKAFVREWAEDACFIFAEGEEYQRVLDRLRAAGAVTQKFGADVGHRKANCLDLATLTVAREQYKAMELDLETARKSAMQAETEVGNILATCRELQEAQKTTDREFHDLTVKLDEERRLSRQAVEEAHQDWSHALMSAVEEHFPLPGREWRMWPGVPDVEIVCEWLRTLIKEVREEKRAAANRAPVEDVVVGAIHKARRRGRKV